MFQYIAFLRAINVGGARIIKMAELKTMFEKHGFESVKTYIQSGNIIFNTKEKDVNKIQKIIGSSILKSFGHDVDVMIRTKSELENILKKNPFLKFESETVKNYITLLSDIPEKEAAGKFISMATEFEKVGLIGKELYALIDKTYTGKSIFIPKLIEKILNVKSTGRNLNTMNKLLLLMD